MRDFHWETYTREYTDFMMTNGIFSKSWMVCTRRNIRTLCGTPAEFPPLCLFWCKMLVTKNDLCFNFGFKIHHAVAVIMASVTFKTAQSKLISSRPFIHYKSSKSLYTAKQVKRWAWSPSLFFFFLSLVYGKQNSKLILQVKSLLSPAMKGAVSKRTWYLKMSLVWVHDLRLFSKLSITSVVAWMLGNGLKTQTRVWLRWTCLRRTQLNG